MAAIIGAREGVLTTTANVLLNARRTGNPIQNLPPELMPANDAEAFFVQDTMMQAYGEIGGYKIGARGPDQEPFFAPMPAAWMGENGSLFRGAMHRLHGVEAEIAFRMGADLPPRATPYTREEVFAAIGSCHPAIEIVEAAFVDPRAVPREASFADMQMHGGFVAGPAIADWQSIDWSAEAVTLTIDSSVRAEKTGSNPGGNDLLRLLVYLANEGAARTHGLRAGQFITTGSWTGLLWANALDTVRVTFATAGVVSLEFAGQGA